MGTLSTQMGFTIGVQVVVKMNDQAVFRLIFDRWQTEDVSTRLQIYHLRYFRFLYILVYSVLKFLLCF